MCRDGWTGDPCKLLEFEVHLLLLQLAFKVWVQYGSALLVLSHLENLFRGLKSCS